MYLLFFPPFSHLCLQRFPDSPIKTRNLRRHIRHIKSFTHSFNRLCHITGGTKMSTVISAFYIIGRFRRTGSNHVIFPKIICTSDFIPFFSYTRTIINPIGLFMCCIIAQSKKTMVYHFSGFSRQIVYFMDHRL